VSQTTTDVDGRFAIGLPAGVALDAIVVEPAQPGANDQENLELPLRSTMLDLKLRSLFEDIEVDVWARAAPSLTITVLDAETGAALPGAEVRLWTRQGNQSSGHSGHSNSNGVWTFSARTLANQEFDQAPLTVRHRDFAPLTMLLPQVESSPGELRLTVSLTSGFVVEGKVLGPGDQPLPGVQLGLRPVAGAVVGGVQEVTESLETKSDDDGTFRFPAIRAADTAWLVAPLQQRDTLIWYGEKRVPVSPRDSRAVVLHLDLQVSVEVKARFPDGSVADRAELQLACSRVGEDSIQPTQGVFLACPVEVPVRILVRAWSRALGTGGPRFIGELTQTFRFDPDHSVRVQVPLTPDPEYVPPGTPAELRADGITLPDWMRPNLRVRVRDYPVDRVNALSVSVNRGGGYFELAGNEAETVVDLRTGWNVIEVAAAGFHSRSFEVFCADRELSPLVIDLVPLN